MFLRAGLIAAVIATVPVGWAAASYAQAPIAAATILPITPVISTDDECGDGWEWSKTVGRCIPAPAAAPTAPPGATFQCVDGTTPTPSPPTVPAPDTAVSKPRSAPRPQ
jgi:hypothetical protein